MNVWAAASTGEDSAGNLHFQQPALDIPRFSWLTGPCLPTPTFLLRNNRADCYESRSSGSIQGEAWRPCGGIFATRDTVLRGNGSGFERRTGSKSRLSPTSRMISGKSLSHSIPRFPGPENGDDDSSTCLGRCCEG